MIQRHTHGLNFSLRSNKYRTIDLNATDLISCSFLIMNVTSYQHAVHPNLLHHLIIPCRLPSKQYFPLSTYINHTLLLLKQESRCQS